MLEAIDGIEEGIKVACKHLKDVRFADDQGVAASTKSGLQEIMDRLSGRVENYELKINIKKTKVARASKNGGAE